MRTACSANLAGLLLAGCASSTPVSPAPADARRAIGAPSLASTAGARAAPESRDGLRRPLALRTPTGKELSLDVELDDNVAANGAEGVEIIGEVGSSVILVDTYLSAPGAMSYCQAGRERFLRVVTIGPKHPEEVLRLKLESCWQHIELDGPVRWVPESLTLHIRWLFGPLARNPPEELTFRVGALP